MLKTIKKILFATDLSEYCQQSYEFAVSIALKLQAGITLLHVIENNPISIDVELKSLLGEDRYEKMMWKIEEETRSLLIGKRSQSKIIKTALYTLCEDTKNNNAECLLRPDEIILKKGNVVEEILSTATTKDTDLILLSLHKNIFEKGLVTKVIKSILRESKIPVLVIPAINNY